MSMDPVMLPYQDPCAPSVAIQAPYFLQTTRFLVIFIKNMQPATYTIVQLEHSVSYVGILLHTHVFFSNT